jgi:hypothetical protein
VGLKPSSESGHNRWLGRCDLSCFRLADSVANEVSMKELRSETRVITDLSSLKMRTAATPKVASKRFKRCNVDVREDTTLPLDKAAEMGRGPDVSDSARGSVSITFQVVRKRVDVWSADSAAQAP